MLENKDLFATLHENLKGQVGLHRQLLDIVKSEKSALIEADLDELKKLLNAKELIIASVKKAENLRSGLMVEISNSTQQPLESLSLSRVIIVVQGFDQAMAEKLRTLLNTLRLLTKRIREVHSESKQLLEKSLDHVRNMKANVIGEEKKTSTVYTNKGKKNSGGREGVGKSRLLSREV